ncbi:quinone oxidoreductase family protein [Nonomuraea rhodomycinica]|uniref:Zinc-binding dehydrogenase n=1 Tax=Nonomuraea rhodomycinica TaxID=1712872 RepID=A0A7Y6IMG3_9ACTN|nr:zinc-binding dehydrogenase [Nonomuraea rhodomycinica]NUW40495.1 zinc-binding dehydrogenase [Nonomuraea rhodomycinica]
MRVIQATRLGGPEVLALADLPDPVPGPGETLVDVEAAGVNFADIKRIEGSYGATTTPFVPGSEVIGRTADGRRVMGFATNAYASKALLGDPVEVPEDLKPGQALALLVQGLSAWHLLRTAARLSPGETVVVNAAAGGVGHLAVQLAREFGAGRVIGTASTPEKRELVLELGADAAVDGDADGYAERVVEAGQGRPADIVLDAVGGRVFEAALGALAPFGRLVTYGSSGGDPLPPVDPGLLTQRNISVTGYWLGGSLHLPGMTTPLRELMELTANGRLRPLAGGEYPLADARRALEDLAGRRTTGKLVLLP